MFAFRVCYFDMANCNCKANGFWEIYFSSWSDICFYIFLMNACRRKRKRRKTKRKKEKKTQDECQPLWFMSESSKLARTGSHRRQVAMFISGRVKYLWFYQLSTNVTASNSSFISSLHFFSFVLTCIFFRLPWIPADQIRFKN